MNEPRTSDSNRAYSWQPGPYAPEADVSLVISSPATISSQRPKAQETPSNARDYYGFTDGSNLEAVASKGMSVLNSSLPAELLAVYEPLEIQEASHDSKEAEEPCPSEASLPTPPRRDEDNNTKLTHCYSLATCVSNHRRRGPIPSAFEFKGANHAPCVMPRPDADVLQRMRMKRRRSCTGSDQGVTVRFRSIFWDGWVVLRGVEGVPQLVVDPVSGRARKRRMMDGDPKQHRRWREWLREVRAIEA